MFADQHGDKGRNHSGKHKMENERMPVGHFQYNNGRGEWCTSYSCEECHHSCENHHIGFVRCKLNPVSYTHLDVYKRQVCLVMASGGYPGRYDTGFEIRNLDKVKDSIVFFAGAAHKGTHFVTNGGRVLNLSLIHI